MTSMVVPLKMPPLSITTIWDRSGEKPQDWSTRDALGAMVMAAPVSWRSEDCSRIWRWGVGELLERAREDER